MISSFDTGEIIISPVLFSFMMIYIKHKYLEHDKSYINTMVYLCSNLHEGR